MLNSRRSSASVTPVPLEKEDLVVKKNKKMKQVYSILKKCVDYKTIQSEALKNLIVNQFENNRTNRDFYSTLAIMTNLEYATDNNLMLIYKNVLASIQNETENTLQISKEYHAGKIDPARYVAKMERSTVRKTQAKISKH